MATPTTEDKRIEAQLNQIRTNLISTSKMLHKITDDPKFRASRYNQTAKLKQEIHKLGIAIGDAIVHVSNL